MSKSNPLALTCALLATAAGACTVVPSDVKPPPQQVVQIGTATADSLTIHCTDPQGGFEQVYHVNFSVEMVNTTDDDVNIVTVGSNGFIFQSSIPTETGAPAQTFASLPFTPTPALVRAHDGDLTVRASMTGHCGTASIAATDTLTRIIVTRVLVTTNSGQYQTIPITFTGTWTHAALMPAVRNK